MYFSNDVFLTVPTTAVDNFDLTKIQDVPGDPLPRSSLASELYSGVLSDSVYRTRDECGVCRGRPGPSAATRSELCDADR